MKKSLSDFFDHEFENFVNASLNIILFLPHYFSVIQLLKTLIYPWKNINLPKPPSKESLKHKLDRWGTNLVSRFIGLLLRISVLITYLFFQIIFIVLMPTFVGLYLIFLPINMVLYLISPNDEQNKIKYRKYFIDRHDPKNIYPSATQYWFEQYYTQTHLVPWWSQRRLYSHPPLARDWHYGFTYYLDQYCTNITVPKKHYRHLIDRKNELTTIQEALSKTENANVIIVGEEGVGRRTIVEALAKLIYEGRSNHTLAYKRIIELNIENILSSSSDYLIRQNILTNMLKEAETAKNIILFLHNLDRYISSSAGHIDLTMVLEKYSKSKKILIIATTTPDNFQKYIYPNKVISSVFDTVNLTPLGHLSLTQALFDAALILEKRYSIIIPTESVYTCLNLADQFMTDLPLPEKAIELLDQACYISINDYNQKTLDKNIFYPLIKQITHIPPVVDSELKKQLITIDSTLNNQVISQNEAIDEISAVLRNAFVVKRNKNKPIASFIFFGPTGVGKTETAKQIGQIFFKNQKEIIRFDMSLYQTKNDIVKLIGSDIEPGLLTAAIRQQRFGVLLLDEIEKADHQLLNIFLTIIDEGYFTDGRGKVVDCRNLIIVATSNAGSTYIFDSLKSNINRDKLKSNLIDYLIDHGIFSPEFLNRFDGIIIYNPLNKNAVLKIAQIIINDIEDIIAQKYNIYLTVSPQLRQQLIDNSYDEKFGARNMQRIIHEEIENKIALLILDEKLKKGDKVNL